MSNPKRFFISIALQSMTLAAGMTAAAIADEGPQVSPNVQVTDPQQPFPQDFPSRSSISIAAGGDGQDLVVGFEDLRGLCGPPSNRACPPEIPSGLSGFAFSTDGGVTWTDGGALGPIGTQATAGHSSVAVMPLGEGEGEREQVSRSDDRPGEVFFYASRLRDATNGLPLGVGVHRGHFAAGTFTWDDAHVLNPPGAGQAFSRQAIATARDGSGAAYVIESDSAAICNTPFAGFGQIEVFRTHDRGDSWQGAVVVSPDAADISDPNNPNCGNSGFLQVANAIAVGPRGEVYAAWQYGPHINTDGSIDAFASIAFSRSLDGGQTFDPRRLLINVNANQFNPPVGYGKNRMNEQPRLAVATSGEHRGRVYLSYYEPVQPVFTAPPTVQSLVSTRSFLMYSDDQGLTWSAPQALGPPVPATGVKRFWPAITVRPGGEVDVAYLESQEVQLNPDPSVVECNMPIGGGLRRTGPAVSLIDTFLVQSRDGGATFGPPLRVSSATTNWCNVNYIFGGGLFSNLGDYIDVTSRGDRTFTVWPDGRSGFGNVFFAAVEGGPSGEHGDH
jgi:hypothetical protein